MATVSLHECVRCGGSTLAAPCGLHGGGGAGWISFAWGGVEVVIHFDVLDHMRQELNRMTRQLDELADRLDRPESNRTEQDDQPEPHGSEQGVDLAAESTLYAIFPDGGPGSALVAPPGDANPHSDMPFMNGR